MDFRSFFDILSFELKQSRHEDKDSEFEYLNYEVAMFYTNECIKELVQINDTPFELEEKFTFNDKTNKWKLPEMYNSASHYLNSKDGNWYMISDSSDKFARVKATSARTLVFNPPLNAGETIIMRVSKYPANIEQDGDKVDFPAQFLRLLRLHIMSKAMGRKGKEMAQMTVIEYNRLLQLWLAYGKPIENNSFLQFRGHGFGR